MWIPQATAPQDALASGVFLGDVLASAVGGSLRSTLRDAVRAPLAAALLDPAGSAGLTWYGQHDAAWAGYYDVCRRIGLVGFTRPDDRALDLWAALARSAGWWWPGERRCVMAERPAVVRTEPLPETRRGERRLHCPDGPAVRFADGCALFALHGTPVPAWVLTDPAVERIHRERNVEVRRCAIERIGWDAYLRQARLALVARCADPGNPGADLCLYDLPGHGWGPAARVLVVVNGSAEPDGQHRRYGLGVPARIDDPVAAAAWSYGLAAGQYARLARRT